jgi:hypothetical protein
MSDPSELAFDQPLAAALADLAGAVEFPPTPDLASRVADEVSVPRRTFWSPTGAFSRGLVAGLASVVLLVGAVGAVGLGTGAIQIRFADGSPLPTPVSDIPNRAFGREVSLEQAHAAIAWPILVPAVAGLGPADDIYLNAIPAGGTVTFVWGDRPEFPAGPDGIGIVITEFAAMLDAGAFEKLVAEGTTVQKVSVRGQPGWWVEGGYHSFFFRDQNGEVVDTSIRLVGDTLIWEHDGVLAMRVEGAEDLDAALRIAHSLE